MVSATASMTPTIPKKYDIEKINPARSPYQSIYAGMSQREIREDLDFFNRRKKKKAQGRNGIGAHIGIVDASFGDIDLKDIDPALLEKAKEEARRKALNQVYDDARYMPKRQLQPGSEPQKI